MNLDTATALQRGLFNMCLELEKLPASALQTRLVTLLSEANQEIERLLDQDRRREKTFQRVIEARNGLIRKVRELEAAAANG